MTKIYILISLLLQLFYMLVYGQESPCPQYFTYIIEPGTNETIGQIEIQSPPKTGELHLKVTFEIAAELSARYLGRLELAQSRQESVEAFRQGRNLLYHLYFPLRHPIPKLIGIWINDKQYCAGFDGNVVTTITLEHTLFLLNVFSQNDQSSGSLHQNLRLTRRSIPTKSPTRPTVTLSQGIKNNIFLNSNARAIPKPTPKPIPKPTSQPTPKPITVKPALQDNNNECGRRIGHINHLISQGQMTSPGEWPWLVALFVVRTKYNFQCAGSILTNKHVLTAAHCLIFNRTTNIHHNVLVVALGRFNLHQFREWGTVNRDVANYSIHPDYSYTLFTGDSDIAVLTLRKTVEFSPFIRPICLWSGSTNLQNVINKTGFVVGWGRDEHGAFWTEDPRMAMMPIVSSETCHRSYPGFSSLTSNRTFCAGTRDGSGPCNGDSGSGLVLYDATTDRYQLRGVVSLSVLGNELLCDLTKYVVFVDVAQYIPWIQQQIST